VKTENKSVTFFALIFCSLLTLALVACDSPPSNRGIVADQGDKKRQAEPRQRELVAGKLLISDNDRGRLRYIQQLHAKYANSVISESADAYRIVSRYKIDCRMPDGRVLPLINVLYASLAMGVGDRMTFRLQGRGQQVRIYAHIYYKNVKNSGEPQLFYQINEWGDLKLVGIPTEAVLSGRVGFHGPIWLMPGEPGYNV
jgi:hypothetical protein